jgi:hypothetical protein
MVNDMFVAPSEVPAPITLYGLQETKTFEFKEASSGIMSVPNFRKIRSTVIELLCAYRQTPRAMTESQRIIVPPQKFEHPPL